MSGRRLFSIETTRTRDAQNVQKIMAQALSHRVIQLSLDYKVISSLMEAEKQTGIGHGKYREFVAVREKAGGYI